MPRGTRAKRNPVGIIAHCNYNYSASFKFQFLRPQS
ncbi:predicted protein [Sclerotinia sclerotiorum 1980 UF-70]|uniref:Uncharacterized protein n=1 Tax=Sclerotinia sclerotiorum (strain ATCC 18683 / 1980 / Ss-1) TaxID=665079 RepID=A7EF91_SCLS1|nr:predicted protein [Sclerotinia sclerotiorum 1980 UF-70]EDO01507.1 predicted protein [Sclerotinia sclerotiorum 1980 UF-70]